MRYVVLGTLTCLSQQLRLKAIEQQSQHQNVNGLLLKSPSLC